jgi:peptide-methionine (S)-S-oxide reductase
MCLRVALLVLALGVPASSMAETGATAVFAGGCFWCMEPPFDAIEGVLDTTSGYTGGHTTSPTYKQVTGGNTGHYESVQVTYDPSRVSYARLLAVYWVNVDPFDATGQFCDKGASYRTAIFVASEEERALAEASKTSHEANFGRDIVTPILPAAAFYPAEVYHQDYYKKNPLRYKYYRYGCRRDQRLEEVWGD